jgi:hypothetical protein
MNKYYIREHDESIGPLTTEQIKTKNITKETWVWKEGLEDWVQVKDLKELELFFKTVRKPLVPIGKNWLFRAYIVIGLLGVFGLIILLASSKDDRLLDKQNFGSPNRDLVKEKSQEPIVKKSIHIFTKEESKPMESTSSSQSKVDAFIEENSAPKSHPKQNALDAFIEQNGAKQKTKKTKKIGDSFMDGLNDKTDFNEYTPKPKNDPTFVGPEQVTFR